MTLLAIFLTTWLFLLLSLSSSSSTSKDSTCHPSQTCIASTSCPWFQQKTEEKAALYYGSDAYNQIRDLLKKFVCNKKERKVCCCTDVSLNSSRCSVPDESEQKFAGVFCSVEEVCDPVAGLVCKTTCLELTQFGFLSGRINNIPNCRCGYVYSIRRRKCIRDYNSNILRMCARG